MQGRKGSSQATRVRQRQAQSFHQPDLVVEVVKGTFPSVPGRVWAKAGRQAGRGSSGSESEQAELLSGLAASKQKQHLWELGLVKNPYFPAHTSVRMVKIYLLCVCVPSFGMNTSHLFWWWLPLRARVNTCLLQLKPPRLCTFHLCLLCSSFACFSLFLPSPAMSLIWNLRLMLAATLLVNTAD